MKYINKTNILAYMLEWSEGESYQFYILVDQFSDCVVCFTVP